MAVPRLLRKSWLPVFFGFTKWLRAEVEVDAEGFGGARTDGDEALLRAFAVHAEDAVFEIDLLQGETGKFGHAQAARVEKFEHGAVAEGVSVAAGGRGEEALDFVMVERAGNAADEARAREQRGEIVVADIFADEVAGKHAQRAEFAGEAGHGVVGAIERLEPRGKIIGRDAAPIGTAEAGEVRGALAQVALITILGVGGETALEGEEVGEALDVFVERGSDGGRESNIGRRRRNRRRSRRHCGGARQT